MSLYRNMDYKSKKNFLIFFTFVLLSLFLVIRVSCFEWKLPYLSQWIEDKTKAMITDEVTEGIGTLLSKVADGTGDLVVTGFTKDMGPGLTKFNEMFGKSNAVGSLGFSIREACQIFGLSLSTIILVLSLFSTLVNRKITETKDNPLKLILMYAIAALLIYESESLGLTVSAFFSNIHTLVTSTGADSLQFKNLVGLDDSGTSFLGQISLVGTVFLNPVLLPFVLIIALVIMWPLIKNYFRLLVELIERYLVSCLLILMFPAIVPTIISLNTRNVFKSYIRMLVCQMFLIIMSSIFIKAATSLIMGEGLTNGIFGYIFTLAFLRVAQRLDSYMQSMGLNVAQTGASLLDAMGGAGKSIINSLKTANNMRKNTGEALQAVGARTGNMNMMKSGSTLAAGLDTLKKTGGIGDEKSLLMGMAKQGVQTNDVSAATSANVLNDYMHNPSNSNNKNLASTLGEDALNAGAQELTGMDGIQNASLDHRTGSLSFDAVGDDGELHSMTLSANDDGLSAETMDSNGEGTGLFINSNDSLNDGEVLALEGDVGSANLLYNTGALGMEEHTSYGKEDIESLTSAEQINGTTFYNSDDETKCAKQNGHYYEPTSDARNGELSGKTRSSIEQSMDGKILNEGSISFNNGYTTCQMKINGQETPVNVEIRDMTAAKYTGRKTDTQINRKTSSGSRTRLYITRADKVRDTNK